MEGETETDNAKDVSSSSISREALLGGVGDNDADAAAGGIIHPSLL